MASIALHPLAYADCKEFAERMTVAPDRGPARYPRAVLATAMLHVVEEMLKDLPDRQRGPVAELAYRCADKLVSYSDE